MRRYHEQWVERTGRTAMGLTGIPATRFRGVVRFLEAFADEQQADMASATLTYRSRSSFGVAPTTSKPCTTRGA